MNIGVEECNFCAAQEVARAAAPPPPPRRVQRPAKAQYGLPAFDWARARRALDVLVAVVLLLVTILLVIVWGWPEALPW